MVNKTNKLAAHIRTNSEYTMPDICICNTYITNLTDDAIENGNFEDGTNEILELIVNAIQGRHICTPQALPGKQGSSKEWITWLLSKAPFQMWTCRQSEGDLILAQTKLTTEEVYTAIFVNDTYATNMRHSKRLKERHENVQQASLPETPAQSAQKTEHATHEVVPPSAPVETHNPPALKNINTFLGSEARKKATDKNKFKHTIKSPQVGTIRIGSVQINSLNYDKLCEIIPLWKKEKYDYLAITDTRCTNGEVVHLKKILRQLNPGDAYWFSGVTDQKKVPTLRKRHGCGHLL